ncbi:DinI-like family protein [Pantoea sp. 1.19]|uniref:DinI-like family protein n=1 Tax=Pantoea sp. 1.19 TaxID=1925589 RepID=UPI00094915BA|nr:DinI-like family protein [Pantoea sp. 1.19]
MFVELVYDKRNFTGLPGANEKLLAELTRRVQRLYPEAEVRVKAMHNPALNTDGNKGDREKLHRMLEEMFDDAPMWLDVD